MLNTKFPGQYLGESSALLILIFLDCRFETSALQKRLWSKIKANFVFLTPSMKIKEGVSEMYE